MRKIVHRSAMTAAAFLAGMAVASATEVNLTAQQKQAIMQSVQTETGQPAPAGFMPRVGAVMPRSVSTRQLPTNVAARVPDAKDLHYVKFDTNDVLLIDPKDRRIADIISPAGTTGAAPSPSSPAPAAPR